MECSHVRARFVLTNTCTVLLRFIGSDSEEFTRPSAGGNALRYQDDERFHAFEGSRMLDCST